MSLMLLLRCHDLAATRTFYANALGFAATPSAEKTLTVEKQGSKLVFTQQDLWKSPPICSGTLYFTVADAAAYYAAIKDKVSIAWPLQNMPYGSCEFGVVDCNGYHLAFQQQA
jgi:predicted enzyme related to lactoylglutathione lyase